MFNLADPRRHVDTRRRRAKPPLAQQQHQMSPSPRSGSRLTIIPTNKSRQIAITVLTPGCLFTPSRRVSFSPSLPVRPALSSGLPSRPACPLVRPALSSGLPSRRGHTQPLHYGQCYYGNCLLQVHILRNFVRLTNAESSDTGLIEKKER